mmetsp:Transcript_20048/g.41294  ORF Transcript_20048/g.41294 Transcript_20048/m.41294 type:complete len:219 (+) Transcript_20048:1111-1767(+)
MVIALLLPPTLCYCNRRSIDESSYWFLEELRDVLLNLRRGGLNPRAIAVSFIVVTVFASTFVGFLFFFASTLTDDSACTGRILSFPFPKRIPIVLQHLYDPSNDLIALERTRDGIVVLEDIDKAQETRVGSSLSDRFSSSKQDVLVTNHGIGFGDSLYYFTPSAGTSSIGFRSLRLLLSRSAFSDCTVVAAIAIVIAHRHVVELDGDSSVLYYTVPQV